MCFRNILPFGAGNTRSEGEVRLHQGLHACELRRAMAMDPPERAADTRGLDLAAHRAVAVEADVVKDEVGVEGPETLRHDVLAVEGLVRLCDTAVDAGPHASSLQRGSAA